MNPLPTRFTDTKIINILAQAPNATAIYSGEDIYIHFANDAMIALWGKDQSVIGKTISQALPEIVGQPFIGILQEVWKSGQTYESKNTPAELFVDGELKVFYFDFIYQAIKNELGETDYILHTTSDVTELNIARDIAIESEAKEQALAHEQEINIELAAINEKLASSMEELSSTNEALQQSKENFQTLNEALEQRVAERIKTIAYLNQELEASNEEILAANEELAATNEELTQSNQLLYESTSKLEKTLTSLAESEYRTRSIIENAPFPIGVYTGKEMVITFANASIIGVWGKGDDVIGKRYADILPELYNQAIFEQLDQVLTTGVFFEARNQRLKLVVNGVPRIFYFNYIFTALKNEAGEIYGVMNTAADVTDVVLAKQALEIAAQEKQELNEELATINEEMVVINEELSASNEEQARFNLELSSLYEKLRISQDELELAIDAAGLGTFDLDPSTGRFTGNNLTKTWFGLQPDDEIELNKATDVIHDMDRDKVILAIQKALNPEYGGHYDITYTIQLSNSNEGRIVRAKGKALFNRQNVAIRLSGVLLDVTEQVTSTQKMAMLLENLAQSEQKFRFLIQQAPVAINVFKTDELIIDSANRKMLEIWGKTEPVDGKKFIEVLPELANQPFIDILKNVLATNQPYYGIENKVYILKNGIPEERYFNFIYQPVKGNAEITDSILQVVTEVTEQVNAKKEVIEINTRLNIAIEAGSLGSTEVDISTGSMICNDRFKACFGWPLDKKFTYNDLFEVMLPPHRESIKTLMDEAIKNNTVYQAEYEVSWPDGSIHWVSAHGKARYNNDGQAIKMVSIVSDITEVKADEQRKNDFIGMVSHELKTPLTSLTAYIQLLQSKASKNDDGFALSVLEKANNQSKKMVNMINSFLNVSRLESGKIHIEAENFDLSLLLNEIEEEFNVVVNSHQFVFKTVQIYVNADREKIGQVINNFISNAVKYSPIGSTIEISCHIDNQSAIVLVRDEGIGIMPEDQHQLFERYYRVLNQPQTVSGFGIGLYLCAEIIERHHGKIWLESEINQGSTFYFSLPI
ncbi:PAS domain-containing protein [Pedobacter agri]|uniref:PAS domain-containing protein n=1 Tax=Pedobacter agri TaxID=454586 RepID=UPI002930B702|nr:PAS domain-containing protein [Pedobacter agri]